MDWRIDEWALKLNYRWNYKFPMILWFGCVFRVTVSHRDKFWHIFWGSKSVRDTFTVNLYRQPSFRMQCNHLIRNFIYNFQIALMWLFHHFISVSSSLHFSICFVSSLAFVESFYEISECLLILHLSARFIRNINKFRVNLWAIMSAYYQEMQMHFQHTKKRWRYTHDFCEDLKTFDWGYL